MSFSLPLLSLAMRGGDLPKSASSSRRSSALTDSTLPPKSAAAVSPVRSRNLNIPAGLLCFGDVSSSDSDDDESNGLSLTDSQDDGLDGTAAPLEKMLKDLIRAAITDTAGPEKKSSKAEVYEVKYEKDAVYVKMEMPGVNKENVKVYLVGNKLVINGVRDSDPDLKDDKTFSARINLKLRKNKYKTAEMKAEMKNGVLKVKIPKIKEMERDDLVYVKVD